MQQIRNTFMLLYNDSPRRLHMWGGMVTAVVALLALNALMPQGLWANSDLAHVLPRAAILVFLGHWFASISTRASAWATGPR